MKIPWGATNRIVPVILTKISDGLPFTGITNATASLNISIKAEKATSVTAFTGANLEAASTVGTYQAPTSGKVRIKEVDNFNKKGEYELHFENSKFNDVNAGNYLTVCVSGVTDLKQCDLRIDMDGEREEKYAITSASGAGALTTVVLPSGANTANDYYNDWEWEFADGTVVGVGGVVDYVGSSTRQLTLDKLLAVTPSNGALLVLRQKSTGAETALSLTTTQVTNFQTFLTGPAQYIRDALKLAASAGPPATASIDDYLVVIDGLIDAIKAKTDQFVFTIANQVDANVRQILTEPLTVQAAENLVSFFDNLNAATTKIVNDVGTATAATDWTTTEKNQIRHRLGIDGTAAAPAADPSLALQTDIPSAATVANAVAAKLHLLKNTAGQIITFKMRSAADPKLLLPGLTVSVQVSFDNAASWNACTGTVIAPGNGYYKLETSAADTNGVAHALYRATGGGTAVEDSAEAYLY